MHAGSAAVICMRFFDGRLRPLSQVRPKSHLPVANVPYALWLVELVVRAGIREVMLAGPAGPEVLGSLRDRLHVGLDVVAVEQPVPGAAGVVARALRAFGSKTLILIEPDVLTDEDLERRLHDHRRHRAALTCLRPAGASPSVPGAVYMIEPEAANLVPSGLTWSVGDYLVPLLASRGMPVRHEVPASYWALLSGWDAYLRANLDALRGMIPGGPLPDGNGNLIAEGARVSGTARVRGCCLGEGALVEDGAHVEESVLMAGAVVCRGARVVSCVLGVGSRVGPGERLEGRALGDGASVGRAEAPVRLPEAALT